MKKKISDFFTALCGLMLLYLIACIVNVNQHNLTDLKYAEWNIIAYAFQAEEAEPEIITTTENVSMVNDSPKVDAAETLEPICPYTEDEIYRLAQLIQAENGSAEDDECLYLTGIVVMKRVKSDAYPNTIEEVIADEGQYATYINGTIDCEPNERCLWIAREILVHGLEKNYPDNLVFQAEFKQGKKVYKKIGHEYFCLA